MKLLHPASWVFSSLLAGCAFGPEKSSIADQLMTAGSCWEVDLSDGLDETSTGELHNLFDCLNRTGNLKAFERLDAAMDSHNRDELQVGISLVRLSNAIGEDNVDMLGLAGNALSALERSEDETELVLRSFVELAYGVPYSSLGHDFDVYKENGLESGIIHPGILLAGQVASDLVDGGPQIRTAVNELRASETLESAECFLATMSDSDDALLSAMFDDPFTQVAEIWQLAEQRDNNRWTGTSGNSIRDLIDAVSQFRNGPQYAPFLQEVQAILADEQVRRNTKRAVRAASEAGNFEHLLPQLHYLSTVDVDGQSLGPSSTNDSALQVGTRLLHSANQPMSCDLLFFEVNVDNMATRILKRLSTLDANQVESGLDFFVGILDGDFAPTVLRTAAESGVCIGFTPALLDDLGVLDRLNDPEVGNLVLVMHELLDAVYVENQVNRLPELVNLVSEVHTQDLMSPIEEILRDLHTTDLLIQAPAVFAHFLDPGDISNDSCNPDVEPLGWDALWRLLQEHTDGSPSDSGERILDVLDRTTQNELLWLVVDRFSLLALQPNAEIHRLTSLSETEGSTSDTLGLTERFLEDADTWNTVLKTMESDDVQQALIGQSGESDRPVGFLASLILSDTVTLMLQTIDTVVATLKAD